MRQEQVPGKGRGMVATRIIRRGDQIQAYTPILSVQDSLMQIDRAAIEQILSLRVAVDRMPPASKALFMDQWGHFGGDPRYDKVNTNAFNSMIGTSEIFFWTIYPESARYNHDCRPNTLYSINNEDLLHNLKAGRMIIPGEEISLSYLSPDMPTAERKMRTLTQWGFNCTCSLCAAPSWVHQASDDRIALIEQLETELNDLATNRSATPATAEMLISLHQQERLDGVVGDAYMYAAFEYAYLGNKRAAQKFAALSLEHMAVWRGTQHHYYQAMLRLLYFPENEKSWKYFTKLNETIASGKTELPDPHEDLRGAE